MYPYVYISPSPGPAGHGRRSGPRTPQRPTIGRVSRRTSGRRIEPDVHLHPAASRRRDARHVRDPRCRPGLAGPRQHRPRRGGCVWVRGEPGHADGPYRAGRECGPSAPCGPLHPGLVRHRRAGPGGPRQAVARPSCRSISTASRRWSPPASSRTARSTSGRRQSPDTTSSPTSMRTARYAASPRQASGPMCFVCCDAHRPSSVTSGSVSSGVATCR